METGRFVTHDGEGREIENLAAMIEQRALLQPAAPAMIMKEASSVFVACRPPSMLWPPSCWRAA
jgi:hypothetical protein